VKLAIAIQSAGRCTAALADAEARLHEVAKAYTAAAAALASAKSAHVAVVTRLERGTGLRGSELDAIADGLPAELLPNLDAALSDCPELLERIRAALVDVDQVLAELRSQPIVSWRG
jgi:hypothetical protein